ncbi:acyltransferase family protein [Janibacter hoylei]|uniref:acyltransferase family protein n=1 Tax=Janibacter hoylei TaxID=364298 RepID=UPI0027B8BF57|nr:acyltransferase [Janibacter hoylei]
MTSRVVGLDALRGLAALAVFVCHLGAYWGLTGLPSKVPQLLDVGAHGVDVFIVLSGFVLGLVAFRAGDSLRMDNFLIRRAVRLSPPYFTALAIATVLAMSPLYSWFVAERATWTDLTWHIFFAQTWNPARLGTINGSLWSVALEAQLYLTFPLIVLIARRWGMLPIVVGAVAMSVLMSSVSWGGPVGAGFTDEHNLPIRLVQFVAGVWGAHRYVSDRLPPRLVLWAMAVLGGLAAVGWSTAAFAPGRIVAWTIPCVGLVLLAAGPLGPSLSRTPFERWGLASYSFYVIHQPVLLLLAHFVRPHVASDVLAFVVGLVVALPVTALAAWVLYVLVERPSHEFGRRHFLLRSSSDPATTRA